MMNHKPRYEIRHTDAGYHVVFVAGNGEDVLAGEPLKTRRNAVKAIESVAGTVHKSTLPISIGFPVSVYHVDRGIIEVRDIDQRTL